MLLAKPHVLKLVAKPIVLFNMLNTETGRAGTLLLRLIVCMPAMMSTMVVLLMTSFGNKATTEASTAVCNFYAT